MWTFALNDISYIFLTLQNYFKSTLQVKVFAWSPFGNQLFWFRETFLQIKSPAPKFKAPHGDQNGPNLEGWKCKHETFPPSPTNLV